jgi:hypothetical protein
MRNLGRPVKLSRPYEIFEENMNFFEQETESNSRQNFMAIQDFPDIIVKKLSYEKEKSKNSPRFSIASSTVQLIFFFKRKFFDLDFFKNIFTSEKS